MKTIKSSILIFLWFTLITGVVYPLLMTGIAQLAFRDQANGSVVMKDGKVVGSELIAQNFTNRGYFFPRPSSVDFRGENSGGYNLGPASSDLIAMVSNRLIVIREQNGLEKNYVIPADMALASASGLDPDISLANAMLQSDRVARYRNIPVRAVEELVAKTVERPVIGFLGEEKVNVLKLNLSLDEKFKGPSK